MLRRIQKRITWWFVNISVIRNIREQRQIQAWLRSGKIGAAPHLVKQSNLRKLKSQFDIQVLVETGTFRADMMVAMSPHFRQLYSIELSDALYQFSKTRCADLKNVDIRHGASEDVLPGICQSLQGRVLFWLDGHFSGGDTALGEVECPVISELNAILTHAQITPIIVIDDAREFEGNRSYPKLREIADTVNGHASRMHITVSDDSILIVPDCLYS